MDPTTRGPTYLFRVAESRFPLRPGASVTAYLAVRFLMRYFETNRLTPFAVYCFAAGAALSVYFALS